MSATSTRWPVMRLKYWETKPLCAPWENGRAPEPWKNTAPARSFLSTKTFTERYWRNRRSRHQLFRIGQYGQAQTNQCAAPFATFNLHFGGIFVEHLKTLGNIGHADAHAARSVAGGVNST